MFISCNISLMAIKTTEIIGPHSNGGFSYMHFIENAESLHYKFYDTYQVQSIKITVCFIHIQTHLTSLYTLRQRGMAHLSTSSIVLGSIQPRCNQCATVVGSQYFTARNALRYFIIMGRCIVKKTPPVSNDIMTIRNAV